MDQLVSNPKQILWNSDKALKVLRQSIKDFEEDDDVWNRFIVSQKYTHPP